MEVLARMYSLASLKVYVNLFNHVGRLSNASRVGYPHPPPQLEAGLLSIATTHREDVQHGKSPQVMPSCSGSLVR